MQSRMGTEWRRRRRWTGAGIEMGSGCAPGLPNPAKETGQIRRLFAHRFVHVRPLLPPPRACANPNRFYRAPSPEADPENGRVPSTYPRSASDSSLLLVSRTRRSRDSDVLYTLVLIDTTDRGEMVPDSNFCRGISAISLIGGKNLMFR